MTEPGEPIRRVMSVGVVAVDEKLTLRSVAAVFGEMGVGVAVVGRSDGSAVIVSERDVVRTLAQGADPGEVRVADVMTEDVVIADPHERVIDVAARMGDEGVRHVAVVENGAIVGARRSRRSGRVRTGEHVTETREEQCGSGTDAMPDAASPLVSRSCRGTGSWSSAFRAVACRSRTRWRGRWGCRST
jgi:CBS domain-containing protein